MNNNIARVIENKMKQKNVLVLGDIMLDEYIIGKVERISPEAPIPILDYKNSREVAGGASNVANNLQSLGAMVRVCGVVGNDSQGNRLIEYLSTHGMDTGGIIIEKDRPTTVKRRFGTNNQQLLRMDTECREDVKEETKKRILDYICKEICDLDAVILSDYTKGMFTDVAFVKQIIRVCIERNVIITIDSKSKNIAAFKDATFIKPNNLELENAVGIKIVNEDALNQAGEKYLNMSQAQALVVTRGAKGISLFRKGMDRQDFASKAVQVFDVTGAGDTVISVITLALACNLSIEEAIVLANYAASVVIGKNGTATLTRKELIDRINEG